MADDLAKATGSTSDVPDLTGIGQKLTDVYKAAEQTEPYKAAQSRLTKEREAYAAGEAELQGLYGQREQEQQKMPTLDYSGVAPVKDLADYSVASSPAFMLIAAIGGVIGKRNALAALESQSAMVGALNQGQMARYEQAKTKHDEAIANIDREHKAASAVFNQMMTLNADRIDAKREALNAAGLAIGADEKILQNIRGDFMKAYERALSDHARYSAKGAGGIKAADVTAATKAETAADQADSTVTNYQTVKQNLEEAGPLLERIKARYPTSSGFNPSSFNDYLNAMKSANDPDYAKLQALIGNVQGILTSIKTSGGGQRLSVFLERVEQKGLPYLGQQSFATLGDQIKENLKFVDGQLSNAKTKRKNLRKIADVAGSRLGLSNNEPAPAEPPDEPSADSSPVPSEYARYLPKK